MGSKMLLSAALLCIMVSCTTEMEDYLTFPTEDNVAFIGLSRAGINNDSLELGELICLERTEDMLGLKCLRDEEQRLSSKTKSADAEIISPSISDDDFFSSNIYAIRELPVTIKVRSVASGSIASDCYFNCNGAGKEVVLSNSFISAQSKFYIKVFPPSAGISYVIYSGVSNTPLCVGYYKNAPDNKILMSAPNNQNLSLYDMAWNLLPSYSNKGYFAIQSESYFGKTDSNGELSFAGYILEAKGNNKIGYSQSYNNKAQQDFLITPDDSFILQGVEYDLENASIVSSAMISKETSYTNPLEVSCKKTVNVILTANETSCYSEILGKLAINIKAPSTFRIQRPIPVANRAILMENIPSDALYVGTTQNISKTINYVTNVEMKPNSLLKLTTKFKTFILNVPYIATAIYEGREVKMRGVWRGYAIANPEYYAPINEMCFFNLETGDEYN